MNSECVEDFKKIAVLPIGPFDSSFTYKISLNENLIVGDIVEIPFSTRNILGLVTDDQVCTDKTLKQIIKKFPFNIGKKNYDFLNWVAEYTLIPRGMILKMILGEKSIFNRKKNIVYDDFMIIVENFQSISLNEEQQIAYQKICEAGNKPFLLEGVTGSGKTEIYLSIVRDMLKKNKQTLILFPEIALIKQTSKRIEKYFGIKPLIWNSHSSTKERQLAWLNVISGKSCIVIGARSALFLPFQNLGLIVVDEEHDQSYKQQEGGFYNARDMSIVLGRINDASVILSSATPAVETYVNAQNDKYGYAFVGNRFGNSVMPKIHLIDIRQKRFSGFISTQLLVKINENIEKQEQTIIYLNRRGYSPITLCKKCGDKIACPNCTTWLVMHKNNGLLCHYCGHKSVVPEKCKSCDEQDSYIPFGPGVERILEELSEKIPNVRILIASSDSLKSEKSVDELFEKIEKNEVDIIVGTQILAKGHHFPNITMVGIIDGDLGLQSADLRASERTYQMIQQVRGRAGRSEKHGSIYIQTFNPENAIFSALRSEDSKQFMKMEIESRKKLIFPPFSTYAAIIISGTNKELTEKVAMQLRRFAPSDLIIFGPAPAPFFLLRGRVRWRILIKSIQKKSLGNKIKLWISSIKSPRNVTIQIDIDPVSFL